MIHRRPGGPVFRLLVSCVDIVGFANVLACDTIRTLGFQVWKTTMFVKVVVSVRFKEAADIVGRIFSVLAQ